MATPKNMGGFMRLVVPTRCNPLVRAFFTLAKKEQICMTDIGARAGVRRETISDWRYRRSPRLDTFEAALNVLGYRLKIVPMNMEK